MTNFNLALTESRSLRSEKLGNVTHESALESLNKAKSLVMSYWKGEHLATTTQISSFYEVPEDTVQTVIKNHRDEFASDGMKVLRGKALRDVVSALDTSSKSPSLTVWTPRAALRLGMLLRDSEVAKAVRDIMLDTVEIVPQQSDRIRELELQNKVLDKQLQLRQLDHAMLTMHGAPTVLALRGMADQVVETEKPTIDIIDNRHNVRFKGQTLPQIKNYIAKKYGIKFKFGADIRRKLEKAGRGDLIAQTPRTILADYIPDENLDEAYRILQSGSRQLLLGE